MSNPARAEDDPQFPRASAPDPAEPVAAQEDWDDSDDDEYNEDEYDEYDDFSDDPDTVVPDPDMPARSAKRSGNWDEWISGPRPAQEVETFTDTARRGFRDRTGAVPIIGRISRRDHDDDEVHTLYPRRGLLLGLGVAALALVMIVVVVANLRMGLNASPSGPVPAAASQPTTAARTTATVSAPATTEGYPHSTADCYPTKTATSVVGAGPGDPTTAPGVILGFDWAYYVDRSGARAREWIAPDATGINDAAGIQAGIDSMVPVATKYCVHITRSEADRSGNVWDVVLSEQFPTDKIPAQWHQTITTATVNGRVLITSIRQLG